MLRVESQIRNYFGFERPATKSEVISVLAESLANHPDDVDELNRSRANAVIIPVCLECKHRHPTPEAGAPMTCDAFPDGIPEEIIYEGENHDEPYPGDHGIRFELSEAAKQRRENAARSRGLLEP